MVQTTASYSTDSNDRMQASEWKNANKNDVVFDQYCTLLYKFEKTPYYMDNIELVC